MSNDTSREDFEAWAAASHYYIPSDFPYLAWQAGRAALAAEQAQQVAVPAREPLTEREIFDIDPCPHEMFDQERIAFARSIEAHHKITPQGDKP